MSLLQSDKRFLEDNMWFFLGDTSLFCSYSVNSNMKFFISFMCLDAYKTEEYQTRAISQQSEMWKQKVKFWYMVLQNVCLHSWQRWICPYMDETISTNCLEDIFFGYQLTNVKEILPKSWLSDCCSGAGPEHGTFTHKCQLTTITQSHKHPQCQTLWATVMETK